MAGDGASTELAERVQSWLLSDQSQSDSSVKFDEGIYIYGAGDLGSLALEYCEACGIEVLGVLDRARSGTLRSASGRGYDIQRPEGAQADLRRNVPVAVAIATLPLGPIREQLKAAGWTSILPFYALTTEPRSGHPLRNGWLLGEVTLREYDVAAWLCRQWSDETSGRHYEAFVAWHRNNSELDLSGYPIDPLQRYAIPQLASALARRRCQFVDVGSHRGESVARMNKAGTYFTEYVLIEPDELSRSHLISQLRCLAPDGAKVSIVGEVLGAARGVARFKTGLGYCSQVWDGSGEERQVVPLDELELNPDFLKVHTEGTEYEVLLGGQQTIMRSRPCLAFSVYHRREGFYDDIARPMKLFPDYRWYFRLHSHQGTGAFVYAVPQEK